MIKILTQLSLCGCLEVRMQVRLNNMTFSYLIFFRQAHTPVNIEQFLWTSSFHIDQNSVCYEELRVGGQIQAAPRLIKQHVEHKEPYI